MNPGASFIDGDGNTTTPEEDDDLRDTLAISSICNDAVLVEKDGQYSVLGNPTEGALVVAAMKVGITRERLTAKKAMKCFSVSLSIQPER